MKPHFTHRPPSRTTLLNDAIPAATLRGWSFSLTSDRLFSLGSSNRCIAYRTARGDLKLFSNSRGPLTGGVAKW